LCTHRQIAISDAPKNDWRPFWFASYVAIGDGVDACSSVQGNRAIGTAFRLTRAGPHLCRYAEDFAGRSDVPLLGYFRVEVKFPDGEKAYTGGMDASRVTQPDAGSLPSKDLSSLAA
jgi:hypothetical protein